MHLVLRSTQATGDWSFRHPRHRNRVAAIIKRFAVKNGVRVLSLANVGNHLHLHIKLGNRYSYAEFIRSVTGAIAQAITGRTRWQNGLARSANTIGAPRAAGSEKKRSKKNEKSTALRFWDYRPFTRVVESWRALLNLRDYIRINQLEGDGATRQDARTWIELEKSLREMPD